MLPLRKPLPGAWGARALLRWVRRRALPPRDLRRVAIHRVMLPCQQSVRVFFPSVCHWGLFDWGEDRRPRGCSRSGHLPEEDKSARRPIRIWLAYYESNPWCLIGNACSTLRFMEHQMEKWQRHCPKPDAPQFPPAIFSVKPFRHITGNKTQMYPVYKCIYKGIDRRKFRSQTSDNMDRWKAE